ncbi:nucleotidyltransferase family protein [Oceanithermus sp.]
MVTPVEIAKVLEGRAEELRGFKVGALYLFGSCARGELGPDSDLDFVVEFEPGAGFDEYMDLKFFLEELFGQRVDLVTRRSLKPRLRPVFEKEGVRVA